jgi:hypothetical protein
MIEQPFGPVGQMDEDGYSTDLSYLEKATAERAQLYALELMIASAHATGQYDVVVSTRAYADDLRDRITRFEELAEEADAPLV